VNLTTEDANPFEAFDDVAAVLAFCHATFGEVGLRELLAMVEADQESLLRDVQELNEIGLRDAAAIVSEAADSAPIKQNPHPEGTANWKDWNRRHHQDFTGFL
jgi:hypothetical protein